MKFKNSEISRSYFITILYGFNIAYHRSYTNKNFSALSGPTPQSNPNQNTGLVVLPSNKGVVEGHLPLRIEYMLVGSGKHLYLDIYLWVGIEPSASRNL